MTDITGPDTAAKIARRILAAVAADPSRSFTASCEAAADAAYAEAVALGWPADTCTAVRLSFAAVGADLAVDALIASGMVSA